MKPFRRHLGALAFAALAAGACNNGDVTKNQTVPPIAGVVGGPDAGGGGGQVALEIQAGESSIVTPGEILVKNLSHEVEDVIAVVPDGGMELVEVKIQGDVGDEISVSLEHPVEGPVERIFVVARPSLSEVRDPVGPQPVIHAGVAAQISGSGFCTAIACNVVLFDNTQIATNEEARPGLLYFTVPAGASLGEHTVRVATAGTNGDDEHYVSESFEVTLVAP